MRPGRTTYRPYQAAAAAFMAAMVFAAGATASGPQFQSSSSGESTHTADLGGGMAGVEIRTYPGDVAYSNSSNPPVIAGFNVFSDGGGSDTTAVGGLGHHTLESRSGFAVSSFPGTVGVSQINGGGFADASELRQTYNNVWQIKGTGWNGPQLAYATFVIGVNLADGDTASFSAEFTHRIDFDGDGYSAAQGDVEKLVSLTTGQMVGPDSTPRILFDSVLLTGARIRRPAVYTVDGEMVITASNQTGPAGIDLNRLRMLGSSDPVQTFTARRLNPANGQDLGAVSFTDAMGFGDFLPNLPTLLRRTHGSGAFGMIPEPASAAMLALGCLLLPRRRRTS